LGFDSEFSLNSGRHGGFLGAMAFAFDDNMERFVERQR
jgi:hypothetical protein